MRKWVKEDKWKRKIVGNQERRKRKERYAKKGDNKRDLEGNKIDIKKKGETFKEKEKKRERKNEKQKGKSKKKYW